MTARRTRWILAITAVIAELVSFVAWRMWAQRHPHSAGGAAETPS